VVPNVSYAASSRQFGIGITRNIALARATGELVRVLDGDDVMLHGAIADLIPRFEDPSIVWAVAQADDLLSDGSRRPYESAMPYGVIKPGQVNDWAMEHGGNWPIHCAGIMLRTQVLRAFGGWAASPADDEISMYGAISEYADGYNDPAVTWLYRVHDGQTSQTPEWKAMSTDGRLIAIQRIHAIRAERIGMQGAVPPNSDAVTPAVKDEKRPSGWWKTRP
jgi:glycosyltransferase involved in cell wall biosynthesis